MNSATPIIPLPDFQRISNTAAGLILSESGRLIGKCVLFGIMGEWLLREKYKISDARAVVGSFGVCVSKSNVIAFAGHQGTADNRENFHCWVEAAGFIFDFSSFLYPNFARQYLGAACRSLMFQKHASQVSNSIDALQEPGDFHFREDRALKETTIDTTLRVPAVVDLLDILVKWYQPPPKKMQIIGIAKGDRKPEPVSIHNAVITGAW
jgi:hypothetical protein